MLPSFKKVLPYSKQHVEFMTKNVYSNYLKDIV